MTILDAEPAGDQLAPRLARVVVGIVFSGFAFLAGEHTLSMPRATLGQDLVFLLTVAILLGCQLLPFSRFALTPGSGPAIASLVLQAVVVYVPFLLYGAPWIGMPGFFGGNLMIMLTAPWSWTAFAVVMASLTWIQYLFTPSDMLSVSYTGVSTVITGLIVYGLTRLAEVVVEVKRTREELARMAVQQERLRFSQDLHDLLGYSLSAITLKTELTRRLVTSHPGRAGDELIEILEISRQALSDVRVVASGYREMSLDQETRSGCSVLAAADIEVDLDVCHERLPPQVSTVLATVLREGITNVLGHSKAEHCAITIDQDADVVLLRIVNDGVQPPAQEPPSRRGTGIGSLSSRVAQLGGRLTAAIGPDGRFHLEARVPLPARNQHAARPVDDEGHADEPADEPPAQIAA
ncbi:histidine kinase [Kitasatospora sp. NBC_01287]|uniref:sensor histidine kinase n=1 Tax=Kitasatospora sp. NBC_01287 TaxID=2903573 RepID=UPI00224FF724|nr:histidine kinase [Kitasatospora sp. NBC_01287]MCX4748878.1 histidine kinase [Kitasatospora sp. NBC_01287]